MSQSNNERPPKPYGDFPLFSNAKKRWAKKISGWLCYFGPWDDWERDPGKVGTTARRLVRWPYQKAIGPLNCCIWKMDAVCVI